jgi:LAS superfamily LD-carboxypeptidase LdcB
MRRLAISLSVAALAILAVAATVSAASPAPTRMGGSVTRSQVVPAVLGLTQGQITELRQDGLTLAQIADQQKVDPQKLIDALANQWNLRIDARVTNGALTADQAAALKANLAVQAKAMVNQAAPGGMQGAAVGAGHGLSGGRGMGGGMAGNGTCTGAGPQVNTTP